jgi:hypothetical protein
MTRSFVFCCLGSCACLLPSGYFWCLSSCLWLEFVPPMGLWACDLWCVSTPGVTSSLWAGFQYGGQSDTLRSRVHIETGRILSPAALMFLCLVCSCWVPLWTVIGMKVVLSHTGLGVTRRILSCNFIFLTLSLLFKGRKNCYKDKRGHHKRNAWSSSCMAKCLKILVLIDFHCNAKKIIWNALSQKSPWHHYSRVQQHFKMKKKKCYA